MFLNIFGQQANLQVQQLQVQQLLLLTVEEDSKGAKERRARKCCLGVGQRSHLELNKGCPITVLQHPTTTKESRARQCCLGVGQLSHLELNKGCTITILQHHTTAALVDSTIRVSLAQAQMRHLSPMVEGLTRPRTRSTSCIWVRPCLRLTSCDIISEREREREGDLTIFILP